MKLVRKGFAFLAANSVQRVVPLLLLPLLSRTLTAEDFASYAVLFSVFTIIVLLCSAGLDTAFVRLASDFDRGHPDWMILCSSSIYLRLVFMGIQLILSLSVFGDYVLGLLHIQDASSSLLFLVVIAAGLQAISDHFAAIAVACNLPRLLVKMRILQGAPYFIGTVAMVSFGEFDMLQLFAILAASNAIGIGYAWISYKAFLTWGRRTKELVVELFLLASPLIPSRIASWTTNFSDRIIIAASCSAVALGTYQVGYSLGAAASLIIASFNSAYVPIYYKQVKSGGAIDFLRVDKILVCLIMAGAVVLICFVNQVSALVGGAKYPDAGSIMAIIIAAYAIQAQYTILVKTLTLKKRMTKVSLCTILPSLVGLALNLFLVPLYGILAAACITYISFGVGLILVYFFARATGENVPSGVLFLVVNIGIAGALLAKFFAWEYQSFLILVVLLLVSGFTVFLLLGYKAEHRSELTFK